MDDNGGSLGGALCVYVRLGDGKERKLANWLHVYKCKTSKVSEVVGEKRTILNLPLQFVALNK